MAGIFFILPFLALDLWLMGTAGRRQWRTWREKKDVRAMGIALLVGVGLAIWFTFFLHYGTGQEVRKGFPIPLRFYRPEDNSWAKTAVPSFVLYVGYATDLLTGLAVPFLPYKIAEFIKQVKAEL